MRLKPFVTLFLIVVAALVRDSSGIPKFMMSAYGKLFMFREYMRQLWAKFKVFLAQQRVEWKQHMSNNGPFGGGGGGGEDMDLADLPEDGDEDEDEDEMPAGLHKQMSQNPAALKKFLAMQKSMPGGIPESDDDDDEDFLMGKMTQPKPKWKKQRVKWVPLVRPRRPVYRRRRYYAPRRSGRYRTRRRTV